MNVPTEVTRRGFLAGVCTLAAAGVVAQPADASTGVQRLPDGRLAVRVRRIPGLSRVGGAVRVGTVKGQPVAVARTGASTYVAFSMVCPHQGAIVTGGGDGWTCPAHGSEFEPDGGLVRGPAATGLPPVRSVLRKGVLTVG